jgi:hypothetical protein
VKSRNELSRGKKSRTTQSEDFDFMPEQFVQCFLPWYIMNHPLTPTLPNPYVYSPIRESVVFPIGSPSSTETRVPQRPSCVDQSLTSVEILQGIGCFPRGPSPPSNHDLMLVRSEETVRKMKPQAKEYELEMSRMKVRLFSTSKRG